MNNKINVIVPFWNVSSYITNCVNSIITQKYDNFNVIFIDDKSDDNSWDLLPHDNPRVICIKNDVRKTALENIHLAIMNHCEPESIVVICDGDDMLLNKKVLSTINDLYNQYDPWFLYGQAAWSDGRKGIARPITTEQHLINMRTRYDSFYISHIRTFKAGLYHKIKEQDENFNCLKDKNGNYYKITYDVAMCLVLCELAGVEKIHYNDIPLYWYNIGNPLNDHKIDQSAQINVHLEILQKKPFKKIDKLF